MEKVAYHLHHIRLASTRFAYFRIVRLGLAVKRCVFTSKWQPENRPSIMLKWLNKREWAKYSCAFANCSIKLIKSWKSKITNAWALFSQVLYWYRRKSIHSHHYQLLSLYISIVRNRSVGPVKAHIIVYSGGLWLNSSFSLFWASGKWDIWNVSLKLKN